MKICDETLWKSNINTQTTGWDGVSLILVLQTNTINMIFNLDITELESSHGMEMVLHCYTVRTLNTGIHLILI